MSSPHDDFLVLHAPGVCPECDKFSDRQLCWRLDGFLFSPAPPQLLAVSSSNASDASLYIPPGATVTLTRDAHFSDVVIDVGGTLDPAGYVLHVSGTLEIKAGSPKWGEIKGAFETVNGLGLWDTKAARIKPLKELQEDLRKEQEERTYNAILEALKVPKEFVEEPFVSTCFAQLYGRQLYAHLDAKATSDLANYTALTLTPTDKPEPEKG